MLHEFVSENMLATTSQGETATVIGATMHRGTAAELPKLKADALAKLCLANVLAGRSNNVGRRLPEQELLSPREIVDGVPRKLPLFYDEAERDEYRTQQTQRAVNQHQRHEAENKVVDTRSPEQRINDSLRAKEKQEEHDKLSETTKMRIESDRRLAAQQVEATRNELRNGKGYRDAVKRLDDLEFIAKFDPSVDALVRPEIQHQRAMLRSRLDVSAVMQNIEGLSAAIVNKQPVETINFAASENVAEQIAQPAAKPWDRPHLKFYDSGVTYFRLYHKGQTLNVSADLVAGKTDDELVKLFETVKA
ncbi:hypothetical protein Pan44_16250 [Caulifigura coniformis]|uniref:Uncharacterized protein n=1 Tax=Caulifigura coniformis TaxID=2527983 RepID=A0A517SBW3_9PLAN|nr:hypothetical protein [Caulifigura coniformis]QDT53603.1 hypothetical protein Pan44_16250 [Caulifigura coniformis]